MKVVFSALCALFSVLCISAFPMPGRGVPAQCADPTFACQDLQSARLCGVVKTCIHDIWSTMSVPDDNDEVCDICKEMVKEARDQLLSNMTQEEIKEVFEGSCKLLPIKVVADACIKVVDEIIPELVEMLASRMDPTMVCTVSGMCFASRNENHLVNLFKTLLIRNKDSQCEQCTQMVADIQVFLKSSSEDEMKKYFEEFCDEKMPSYLCDVVVKTYFSEVYNFILNSDATKLCSSVGICPQKCEVHDKKSKVNDELTCEFCYHVLEHVKDLITTNTTMEEFKSALLNFCNHTGSFHTKCTALVNDYYDMLFNYIKQLDSKGFCTLIGLCNNDSCSKIPLVKIVPALDVRRKIPLIKLRPAEKVPSIEDFPLVRLIPANIFSKKQPQESNDIFQLPLERITHPLTVFQKNTECALCKAFSIYLEKDLAGDISKDGVRRAIDGVCDKWMKEYPDQCKLIVGKYSMKFQIALAKGDRFDQLCTLVKACPLEDDDSGLYVKVIPSVKDNPFCDLCKDAMNEVEKQLSDPATKQKLENLLGQVCNVLPASLKDDCTNFINQNIDAVIDILEQELKPDNICPAIGLCPASLKVVVPQRVKDLECDVCKDVVTSFRQKLQDPASKEIVQTFLEEGCVRLPGSIAAECKKFVDENIDTVMSILVQEMDPSTVCSILNICPGSLKKVKPQPLKDIECDLCKEVVTEVVNLVKDKKTEDEIKKALDSVCTYLPTSISAKCVSFVNQYTDLLITLLAQELDPGMVCAALNVCPAALKKETPKRVKDIECDLCKEVVGQVLNMVKDQKTEDEIKKALDSVCTYLPSSISAKCVSFVNQYTDLLITLLVQELDPDMVCAALNVCPAALKKPKKVKDLECDLCKEVVSQVEDMIKDKKTEDEIKNALDSVCSYLPASIATKCENFVNQYTDLLISLLAQELDPDMVCAALNVCPAQDMECQSCQYAFHFVQQQLMNPDTQGEVKNVLKKLCDILPESFSQNCDAFVDEYGSSLLTLIAQEIDPSTLCYQLQMCSNKTSLFKLQPQAPLPLSRFQLDECSVCTTVVDYLDKMLEEDDVDKEITQVIEKVCIVVPSSFRGKCSTILEAYGPYILQMIGQLADSKQVCQDIDLCPRSPEHVHLIGGSKCTFGPSYWCQSTAHAAACKAELFCKTRFVTN